MATWHQQRNAPAMAALWAPVPGRWKCISNKPGQSAGAMLFESQADAERYAERTGDIIIPPARGA